MSTVKAAREIKKSRKEPSTKKKSVPEATNALSESPPEQLTDVEGLLESINSNMCRLEQLVNTGEVALRDRPDGAAVHDLMQHVSNLLKKTEQIIEYKEAPQNLNRETAFGICAKRSKYRRLVIPSTASHTM